MQRKVSTVNLALLDPLKMLPEQGWVVLQYFKAQIEKIKTDPNAAYISANKPCTIEIETEDGPIEYTFTLNHSILIREREHVAGEYRFEVISNDAPIAAGGYGQILKVEATLSDDNDNLIIRTNKSRVIKKQFNFDVLSKEKEIAKKEYSKAKNIQHVHIKKPVFIEFFSDTVYSFTVMHFLKELTLKKVIDKDLLESTDDLLEFVAFLWMNYVEQIEKNNYVHRDIKPDNIMTAEDFFKIYFIDFGSCIDRNASEEGKTFGTIDYLAPEYKSASTSEFLDIYSLMVTTGELLKLKNKRFNYVPREKRESLHLSPFEISEACQNEFFKHLNDDHAKQILNLIEDGTSCDAKKRPLPSKVIDVFENIRLERMFVSQGITDKSHQEAIRKSNQMAKELRLKLIDHQKEKLDLVKVKDTILTNLNNIIGVDYECDEFVKRLGVKAFLGLKQKNEIIKKLEDIEEKTEENQELLAALLKKVLAIKETKFLSNSTENKYTSLVKNIVSLLDDKYTKKGKNIDDLVALNEKVSKELLPQLNAEFDKVKDLHQNDLFLHEDANGKYIKSVCEFLCGEAKKQGISWLERRRFKDDFLSNANKIDRQQFKKIVAQDKIVFLIEFYSRKFLNLSKFSSAIAGRFKKIAKENMKTLSDVDLITNNSAVLDVLNNARNFILVQKELMNILLDELNHITNEDLKDKLFALCNAIDDADSIKEINYILEEAKKEHGNDLLKPQSGLIVFKKENLRSILDNFQSRHIKNKLIASTDYRKGILLNK